MLWTLGLVLTALRACLVCAFKQPYQNWLANFLAQDLATHGLPKFWQESVKMSSGPLAAK
jgi:hypothetical protein